MDIERLSFEHQKLKYQIKETEQYSKKNNVIINDIPRRKNENLKETISKIAEKLNTSLFESMQ